MARYRFRLINVFTAGRPLSGNPLCVFEDARGLSGAQQQALALQFNLSETTFVFPAEDATRAVRIFTPAFEMPFAGHPTLGTAHVVRELTGCGDALTLAMKAGVIPVTATGDRWTLKANAPTWRPVTASRAQLAQMLGLAEDDVGATPLWVNTGTEQLVIPLASPATVAACAPDVTLMKQYAQCGPDRYMAYVWAQQGDEEIQARFFFPNPGGLSEDPATGSACANLGGWFLATKAALPLRRRVAQGDAVGRPSLLYLTVDGAGGIQVAGDVEEIGRGEIQLDTDPVAPIA